MKVLLKKILNLNLNITFRKEISDYLKQREEPKIKKIDLAQGDFEKTVSGLTSKDKDLIKELLRKSGIRVSD